VATVRRNKCGVTHRSSSGSAARSDRRRLANDIQPPPRFANTGPVGPVSLSRSAKASTPNLGSVAVCAGASPLRASWRCSGLPATFWWSRWWSRPSAHSRNSSSVDTDTPKSCPIRRHARAVPGQPACASSSPAATAARSTGRRRSEPTCARRRVQGSGSLSDAVLRGESVTQWA